MATKKRPFGRLRETKTGAKAEELSPGRTHRQDLRSWDLHLYAASQELQQHPDAFASWEEPCHQGFHPLKGPFRDLHRFTDFNVRVERNDLLSASLLLKVGDQYRVNRCNLVPKPKNSLHPGRVFDLAMLVREREFGKNVAGEHGLDDPHRAASCLFAESDPRRKTFDAELTSQGSCRQMLMLRLRL